MGKGLGGWVGQWIPVGEWVRVCVCVSARVFFIYSDIFSALLTQVPTDVCQ